MSKTTPEPTARIVQMRRIVERKTAAKVGDTTVDLFSASCYVQVWEELGDAERRTIFDTAPLEKAMRLVWRVMKPAE